MQLPLKLSQLAQVAAVGPPMRPLLNWRPPVAEVALGHNRRRSLRSRWRSDLRTTMRKPERMQARSVLTKKARHTANTHMLETRDT